MSPRWSMPYTSCPPVDHELHRASCSCPPYETDMIRLLQSVRGLAAMGSLALLSLLGFLPLLVASLLKLALPSKKARETATRMVLFIASTWARLANAAILTISGTRVSYKQTTAHRPGLHHGGRYLLICNHQCWADALLLVHALDSRLPFPRFFIKSQLRWLPIVGLAFQALDFPFLKRHSQAEIAANPQLRDDDRRSVQRACRILRTHPFTLVNYAEGTRSTRKKRAARHSPYHMLLPPKAGGTALALDALGDVLDGVLDMTIAYVDAPDPTFWDFLCGRIKCVTITVREVTLPASLAQGDYQRDADYRQRLKQWMNNLWQTKDSEVSRLQDPQNNP